MAHSDKWNYAYRIEGNTIFVEDACHQQNMHDSIKARLNLIESLGLMHRMENLPKRPRII